MKNKRFALLMLPLLMLSSCGEALELCREDNSLFPENINMPNYTLGTTHKLGTPSESLTRSFADLPEDERNNSQNGLEYARKTNLKETANLADNVSYIKLFDGVISCGREVANSRLHLYSTGVVVNLNRYLTSADRVGVYMTSSTKILKAEISITLYTIVNRLTSPQTYDAYEVSFEAHVRTNTLEPYFYSFSLLEISASTSVLNASMIGFSYTRLPLTEEEQQSGNYFDYIEDEKDSPSFLKVYDISLPNSTWSRP